jgi:hypothetical protein
MTHRAPVKRVSFPVCVCVCVVCASRVGSRSRPSVYVCADVRARPAVSVPVCVRLYRANICIIATPASVPMRAARCLPVWCNRGHIYLPDRSDEYWIFHSIFPGTVECACVRAHPHTLVSPGWPLLPLRLSAAADAAPCLLPCRSLWR